jgi:hypothetical protein
LKLTEVLSRLQNTYKSIDLYVASASYEGKWLNLLTLIRFSNEDDTSINKQISMNEMLTQLGKGNTVRINRKAFLLEYLPILASQLKLGVLDIGEETIQIIPVDIMNDFDLTLQRSYPQKDEWGSFSSTRGRINGSPYNLASFYDNLKTELIPLGAADIFVAIRNYFKLEYNPYNNNYDLAIESPIYARIKNIELSEKKLQVKATYHKNITDLILHYDQRAYSKPEKIPPTKVFNTSKGKISTHGELVDWEVDLEELSMDQSYENITCDVSLYIPKTNDEVSRWDIHLTQLIAEKKFLETNPLAKVFARFCTVEDFTKLFTNPISINKGGFKLDKSDNFERVAYWLFTLHGFQTIWLGDYEIIDKNNHAAGSTDLLCYNSTEKALAVVSCKIKVPEPDDIDKIKNLAEKISYDVKDLGIRIFPIIVSSESCNTIKDVSSKNGVDIVDINDIKRRISKLHEIPPSPSLFLRDLNVPLTE